MTRIAVVGAGLAGLVVARRLRRLADVTVFDKSRGAGGRMATRYADDYEFDHGAQFFTARTASFRNFLQPLIAAGDVADWQAQFAELDGRNIKTLRSWGSDYPHFVGAPRMNRIGKVLSADLDIVFEATIASVDKDGQGWILTDGAGTRSGPFDWVVLTAPAPQTATLASRCPSLVDYCGQRHMLGCFALMLGFAEPVDLRWQAAIVRNADISWISVNSSKPGRKPPFTLVVHSTNAWADAHIDDDHGQVLEHLLDQASMVTGRDLQHADYCRLHRWRYANSDRQPEPGFFINETDRLAACGDWCIRGRIEAAFTSADNLAGALAEKL